ncbi:hypothetical protein CEP54_014256 [Fusarium duplospermum]|uniref:Uncharacterized protein n=1 Tax=Fusarium duplospermum TaxID=1325734 RepID=A0A428NXD3_9HYPO|nr:hypothetical protein CEP54_014256 [Fusarium duplospermum]
MSSGNLTLAGDTIAQGVLTTHQGSTALEVVNPSHLLPPGDDTGSIVSRSKSIRGPHHFYQDEQVSDMVDRWRDSPHEFLGMWPGKNAGCWIHENLDSLSETSPVEVVKRRVYLFHYYKLNEEFGEFFFASGKTNPLRLFLQKSYDLPSDEEDLLKKNHTARLTGGRSSRHMESKSHDPSILAAAVKSIEDLGEMEKYDEAAKQIHQVLNGVWAEWLDSIKPMRSKNMRVLDLFHRKEIAQFIHPDPSCHSQNSRSLSTGTASSTILERTGPIQEAAFTAPEAIVTAEDTGGIERQFDLRNLQQALVLVQDISGYGRYVRVRTLTDVLSNHGAEMQVQPPRIVSNHGVGIQLQPPHIVSNHGAGIQSQPPHIVFPAMAMPSESTFPSSTFINQADLWSSGIV